MSEALNLKLLLLVIFHLPVISLEALLVLHKISMMSKTSVKTLKLEIVPVSSYSMFTFSFCNKPEIQTGLFLLQLFTHAQLRHDKEFLLKKTDGSGIIQDLF